MPTGRKSEVAPRQGAVALASFTGRRFFSRRHTRRGDGDDDDDQDVPTELVAFTHNEDMFLTSANLCRWVIDFNEIQLGNQLGMGSYGVVYKGRWKGVDVAVKKFVKQKLDESHMLEFRAEMAFLSECHHPNIILFIGALFTSSLSSSRV